MSDSTTSASRFGSWLGVTGLLFAAAAGAALVVGHDFDAGDVEAIEASLAGSPPITARPADAGMALTRERDTSGSGPLLAVNEITRLDQLGADARRIPTGLRIPALGVDAPVDPYGINSRTGQMAVPGTVRHVGWYEHGSSPGEAGSAVLAAHVDLRGQGRGVFFDLETLDEGQLIAVTYDDGTEQWFVVSARKTYQKEALPLDLIFSRDGSPVLTLVTCGGGFSSSEGSYDGNVVVYASPIEETPGGLH